MKTSNQTKNQPNNRQAEPLCPGEHVWLEQYEADIERDPVCLVRLGRALSRINDLRLYRETAPNFAQYAQQRFGFNSKQAYDLLGSSDLAVQLHVLAGCSGTAIQVSQRLLRQLIRLSFLERHILFGYAKRAAGDKPVTAQHIEQQLRRGKEWEKRAIFFPAARRKPKHPKTKDFASTTEEDAEQITRTTLGHLAGEMSAKDCAF